MEIKDPVADIKSANEAAAQAVLTFGFYLVICGKMTLTEAAAMSALYRFANSLGDDESADRCDKSKWSMPQPIFDQVGDLDTMMSTIRHDG